MISDHHLIFDSPTTCPSPTHPSVAGWFCLVKSGVAPGIKKVVDLVAATTARDLAVGVGTLEQSTESVMLRDADREGE